MVVEFIIQPKFMKKQLLTSIFIQEYDAFKKEIEAKKVSVERDDEEERIIVSIDDKILEKQFIDGFKSTRERLSMKVLSNMCKMKVLVDGKEAKLW